MVLAVGRVGPQGLQLLGSSFVVRESQVATTAHVTGGDDSNLVVVVPRIRHLAEYQDTSDQRVRTIAARIRAIDPVRDLSVLDVAGVRLQHFALATSDEAAP